VAGDLAAFIELDSRRQLLVEQRDAAFYVEETLSKDTNEFV
jgi:hypothetical protein